jgi:two-component system CheB/CheR fusion protein
VLVSDIASDPFWKDHKHFALKHGLRACSSYPVLSTSQRVVATFAVYYRQVRLPSPRESTLIEKTKNILGLLIENREAEENIRISNERYRLVLNVTNEAIWEWDAQSNRRAWGEGFQLQFGYRSSEVQRMTSWTSPIHPEDSEQIIQSFQAVIESNQTHRWEAEYRYRKADQTYAYVYDRGLLLRNPEGKPVRMIGAMVDITERKENVLLLQQLNDSLEKRAQELAESNAELEHFAYVASHDLQEPLRMVRSFLQLLQKKYQNQLDERAEEYIRFAVDGAETMKKLILDLLEYSRVGTNQEPHERVDLNEVLQYVVSLFERDIQDTEAYIQIPPFPVVRGNRSQLIQLFQNLLGNALKYRSNCPPRLVVAVEEKKENWLFSVEDNGIGIDKAFFEKVFIIFQRLHNKNAYSGTGIGLAICKKIVERHGGKIWLDSIPGQGTTFYLTIRK